MRRLDAEIYLAFRRPIPKDVALSEARWILARQFLSCIDIEHGMWAFDFGWLEEDEIELLGGYDVCDQMQREGPGALWRWVEENRNG